MEYLAQFTTDIRHIKGKDNPAADALSHININTLGNTPATVNLSDMADTQQDPELKKLQDSLSSLKFEEITVPNSNKAVTCDMSTGTPRPYVPPEFRHPVFESLHCLSQPGIRASQRLITDRYVWPGKDKDVCRWAHSCVQCQRAKIHRHTSSPLSTFETPNARFNRVRLDLVGPLPPSNGYTYILTCIDRYTRWPEALPIPNITAETVASHFISGWISRFGVPSTVMTDRGRQLESALWTSLMQLLGSTRLRTTAYHPSSNGMIERFHRQLKATIKAYPSPDRWTEVLPMVLLGIRTCLKSDLGCSTAELVYGTTLKLPSDFFITTTPNRIHDPSSYVDCIKSGMQSLKLHLLVNSYVILMSLLIWPLAHMCFSDTMDIASPYSLHIMDPTNM